VTAGRIVETEAYLGPEDGASHAAFRPSARPLFYGPAGRVYVFQAYGLHLCLNVIAGPRGVPGCVLIRAIEPIAGQDTMRRRRRRPAGPGLTDGPGKVTQALGVRLADNGRDLVRGPLAITAGPRSVTGRVLVGPRVGITRSAGLPLRFRLAPPGYRRSAGRMADRD
jgi:DNA-3-methyladenine glycosylase